MDNFSCSEIKDVVYMLMSESKLKNKIFIAGGVVPWVLSDRESERKHGDIDIIVDSNDMECIRDYLKEKNYYQKETDSKFFGCNKRQSDYGVEVFINEIPVNFAPFEIQDKDIIQRNFALERLVGYDALFIATIKNIYISDYITSYTLKNGLEIGSYTLETVQATKESSKREKDINDLEEIKKIGINQERYIRIKDSIQNMNIDFIADN